MPIFKESLFALTIFLFLVQSNGDEAQEEDTIDKYLGKHYTYQSQANFDKLLGTLELWYLIPVAAFWYPTDTLMKSGDLYTYYSDSFIYPMLQEFNLNTPKSIETIDGRKVESTFTTTKNVLREVQVEEHGRKTTIVRRFTDETLTIIIKVGNVTAIRLHTIKQDIKGDKSPEDNNEKQPEPEETKPDEPEET